MGKPAPEGQTMDFNEARDDGMAVASAVPYANHLHPAPDMTTMLASNHSNFLQAGCSL